MKMSIVQDHSFVAFSMSVKHMCGSFVESQGKESNMLLARYVQLLQYDLEEEDDEDDDNEGHGPSKSDNRSPPFFPHNKNFCESVDTLVQKGVSKQYRHQKLNHFIGEKI